MESPRTSKAVWYRWAGAAGLLYVVLQVIMTVLFFVGGPPPPVSDTAQWAAYSIRDAQPLIWIGFINGVSYTIVVVFVVGVKRILADLGDLAHTLGEIFYASAILSIMLNFVGGSLIGSTGLDAQDRPEPAALRALYEGGGPMIGAFALFPAGLMLIAAAAGFQQSRVFPRSFVWVGYVAGVSCLVATLSLFGGTNPIDLFSSTGVAGLALGLLPLVIWIGLVSVVLWRRATKI
jgi:hypothetical protein